MVIHDQALQLLRDPDAMRLFLAGHRFNDQLIAIKLPPEEGMEEDFKPSIRDQDTPASQRAFIHLIEDYANFIVQKAKENPFMAQVIIAGMQAVISGPVSTFISVAKDLVLGDTIEDLETKIVQFVSNHLDVPENKVEITENCFKLAFALFLGGKTKAIVQKAEGVVQAVKKLKSKTALNPHKLSEQGRKAVQRAEGTYKDLVKSQATDAHHIIQDAAVKNIPGYNRLAAPAVQLKGPSTRLGTEHNKATKVQRATGGGDYGSERRIGYKALRRSGLEKKEAREQITRADEYFEQLGVKKETKLKIPQNRKKGESSNG